MSDAVAGAPRRLAWQIGEVVETNPETPRTKSLFLEVPGWQGHRAGQHVDVRLTAEDGYQAQRSYSIASAPEEESVELVVERLDDLADTPGEFAWGVGHLSLPSSAARATGRRGCGSRGTPRSQARPRSGA